MVKKIRLVDENAKSAPKKTASSTSRPPATGIPGSEFAELMDLMKSMDWKLWEMLQIMQRREKIEDAEANETKSK
tara:strand:+ start:14189 stop:14413 length:225 start_codon:yes stop_codon:yes gene_type:complete